MPIISYSGQRHRTQNNVVEQPAFLRSDQKPLKWWAQGGLVYCIDPNQPNDKPKWSQPLDALRRVAAGIKIFLKDITESPKDYVVTRAVLADFFNNFKSKVYDIAVLQDEQGGNFITRTKQEYEIAKQEMIKEERIEAAKRADKKSLIFITPKAAKAKSKRVKKEEN